MSNSPFTQLLSDFENIQKTSSANDKMRYQLLFDNNTEISKLVTDMYSDDKDFVNLPESSNTF